MITKTDAIVSLRPKSNFVTANDVVIEWLDANTTAPTESEINAEITCLQAEYDAKEYQRKRAAEYPSFAEQFDTLYHGGYDAWKATIDSVKAKYPKP
jgi:hypothetical protein